MAKTRYTVVEFDVVTYSIDNSKFTQTNQRLYDPVQFFGGPPLNLATQSNISVDSSTLTASNIFTFDVGSQGTSIIPENNFFDGFNGEVWSVDKQSDGKIIVSGNFTEYNGSPTPKPKICRIDNGVLDMSFNPDINDFNPTYIDFIKVLVVKDYLPMFDKIFLIINYTQLMSVNSYPNVLGRVIRLEPDGTFVGTISNLQKEFNSKVTDIAVRPTDGLVVIVGLFTAFYYNSTNVFFLNKMALFEYNTSTNLSFSGYNLYSGSNSETRGFSFFDSPSTIAFLSDGSIIIGVAPKEIGPASNTNARSKFKNNSGTTYYINGIVKLNTNSTKINVDIAFLTTSATSTNMKGFSLPSSFTLLSNTSKNFINRIKVDSSNRIYVVGNFTSYNDGTLLRTCKNIVRLNSNGSFDTTFITGTGLNSFAYDIEFSSNYSFSYIGGEFTNYNNQSCGKVISVGTNGVLQNTYVGGTLNPSTSVVRTMVLNGSNLVVGGTFSSYQQVPTTTVTQTITTSECVFGLSLLPEDIINIAVKISLNCQGSNLDNITINLKSPDNKIICLKKSNVSNTLPLNLVAETLLTDTVFDILSNTPLSSGNKPYTGTFSMEKQTGIGTLGFGVSNSTNIEELVTTNTLNNWTIYIQNENSTYPILNKWELIITYKRYIIDDAIDITPSVDLPILHFNNLNFEIGSQPSGNETIPIYRRMSYLPITQNINHLSVQNSFRFDSIEKTSAERYTGFGSNTIKKKYEYFYNKTDLMMSIQGNGNMGGSQSMMVLDNIKMYETDMIPFFKYFEDANIYKGIQIPYEGVAPNIDYLNSDFVFVDNVTIGIDSLDSSIMDNTIICVPNVVVSASSSVIVTTNLPTNIATSSVSISGNVSIQGNVQYITSGLYLSLDSLQANSVDNPVFDGLNFSKNQTGLLPSRTYYVQAFAFTRKFLTINGILTYESPVFTTGQFFTFSTDRLPPDYSNDYSGDYSQ